MTIEAKVMPTVKASEILSMLEAGKSRKEIAAHYGIPTARLVKIIKGCPQLANKKKAANPVDFVNDLTETHGTVLVVAPAEESQEAVKESPAENQ